MYAYSVTWIVYVVALAPPPVSPCRTAPETIGIVAPAVIELLPEDIRPFFLIHRSELIDLGAGDRLLKGRDAEDLPSRHFIAIDALRDRSSSDKSTASPRPRRKSKALRMFKERGIANGGRLPWVLLDAYRGLTLSFRQGRADLVVRRSAAVLHFAIDANMPFNTTSDPQGRDAGNVVWVAGEGSSELDRHRSVWQRFQTELFRRQADRFAYEVRVWPGRLRELPDGSESVWQALFSANNALGSFLTIERDLVAALNLKDADAFLGSQDRYYEELSHRAGSLIETRLESAALLAAGLIASAWSQADRPSLSAETTSTKEERQAQTDRTGTGKGYVGSSSSQVFHRPTCRHVKRIRPDNLVQFTGIEEASKAGRRPCKTCSPRP